MGTEKWWHLFSIFHGQKGRWTHLVNFSKKGEMPSVCSHVSSPQATALEYHLTSLKRNEQTSTQNWHLDMLTGQCLFAENQFFPSMRVDLGVTLYDLAFKLFDICIQTFNFWLFCLVYHMTNDIICCWQLIEHSKIKSWNLLSYKNDRPKSILPLFPFRWTHWFGINGHKIALCWPDSIEELSPLFFKCEKYYLSGTAVFTNLNLYHRGRIQYDWDQSPLLF